jgi:hypothetical protein
MEEIKQHTSENGDKWERVDYPPYVANITQRQARQKLVAIKRERQEHFHPQLPIVDTIFELIEQAGWDIHAR